MLLIQNKYTFKEVYSMDVLILFPNIYRARDHVDETLRSSTKTCCRAFNVHESMFASSRDSLIERENMFMKLVGREREHVYKLFVSSARRCSRDS